MVPVCAGIILPLVPASSMPVCGLVAGLAQWEREAAAVHCPQTAEALQTAQALERVQVLEAQHPQQQDGSLQKPVSANICLF